jgi:hypothetical protein
MIATTQESLRKACTEAGPTDKYFFGGASLSTRLKSSLENENFHPNGQWPVIITKQENNRKDAD